MTCAPFDLKDYLFGELNPTETESVERHLMACTACQDEVDGLNATRSAVLSMREEEPLRRIAFVSDKVFEPRWWQKIFASGPQLGFASAAMLALAIVFHAVHAPVGVPIPAAPPVAQVDQKFIEAEVSKRVAVAVQNASADMEARQAEKLLQAVNARLAESDRRHEMDLRTVADVWDRMNKRNSNVRRAAYQMSGVEIQ